MRTMDNDVVVDLVFVVVVVFVVNNNDSMNIKTYKQIGRSVG